MTLLKRLSTALLIGLMFGAGTWIASAQTWTGLTNLSNLRLVTDSNGALRVYASAYASPQTPLTAFPNLRGRSDSNGALNITIAGGVITPTSTSFTSGALLSDGGVDGTVLLTNAAGTIPGFFYQRGSVETVATTKTPTELESGELYTNGADVDGLTITLPNDPSTVGIYYQFSIVATVTSGAFTIVSSAGETLKFGNSTCGTSLTATAIGSTVTIMATKAGSGGIWAAIGSAGTWTCNA